MKIEMLKARERHVLGTQLVINVLVGETFINTKISAKIKRIAETARVFEIINVMRIKNAPGIMLSPLKAKYGCLVFP